MSIEDFIMEEVKASGLNIHVTTHLDVDGYADEIADEVDDQLFHAVAIRKGYVPERTCRITDEEPIEIPDQDPWYGMLDTGITRYKLSCGHDTLSEDCDGPKRCCECGAVVVGE